MFVGRRDDFLKINITKKKKKIGFVLQLTNTSQHNH